MPPRACWCSAPLVTRGDAWLPSLLPVLPSREPTSSSCAPQCLPTWAATAARPGSTPSPTCESSCAGARRPGHLHPNTSSRRTWPLGRDAARSFADMSALDHAEVRTHDHGHRKRRAGTTHGRMPPQLGRRLRDDFQTDGCSHALFRRVATIVAMTVRYSITIASRTCSVLLLP